MCVCVCVCVCVCISNIVFKNPVRYHLFWITFSISVYIMCVCLFSDLSRRVGALQISIIIIIIIIKCYCCGSLATSSGTALRDASTSNGSGGAPETPSTPAGSTLRGTALDNAFHPTRETRGPLCQEPENGGHESCGHDWMMPHSRHCDER